MIACAALLMSAHLITTPMCDGEASINVIRPPRSNKDLCGDLGGGAVIGDGEVVNEGF
jgi:hypothetical protein